MVELELEKQLALYPLSCPLPGFTQTMTLDNMLSSLKCFHFLSSYLPGQRCYAVALGLLVY